MYHEATIANLFEVLTYYDTACQSLGDNVLDLLDWCVRKTTYLISKAYSRPAPAAPAASTSEALASGLAESATEALDRQLADLRFGVGVVAVTVLRYLTEHVLKLPLGLMTRLLDTHGALMFLIALFTMVGVSFASPLIHGNEQKPLASRHFQDRRCMSMQPVAALIGFALDVLYLQTRSLFCTCYYWRFVVNSDALLLLIPLIENPPWTRRTKEGKWEKFINQKWTEVAHLLGCP